MFESLVSLHRDRITEDVFFDIARGCYRNASHIHKFGANPSVNKSTTPETVWSSGGLYPWDSLNAASVLVCASTSASDAGTLTVIGLDADWNDISEEVTLTGTVGATTTNTFIRVFRLQYQNGLAANVGDITAKVSTVVVGHITATFGQSLVSIYSVPAGYTGYLLTSKASVQKNKNAQVQMVGRQFGGSFQIGHIGEVSDSSYDYDFKVPLVFPEKSDIEIRVSQAETNGTRVTASFDMVLVKGG